MLASGAFLQVQSSLRWFVDNFSTIADWRATLLRVAGFRRAVIDTDIMHDVEKQISYATGKAGEFDVNDLQISSPSGCTLLQEKKVQIKARRARADRRRIGNRERPCYFVRSRVSGPGARAPSPARPTRKYSMRRARPIFLPARCARSWHTPNPPAHFRHRRVCRGAGARGPGTLDSAARFDAALGSRIERG